MISPPFCWQQQSALVTVTILIWCIQLDLTQLWVISNVTKKHWFKKAGLFRNSGKLKYQPGGAGGICLLPATLPMKIHATAEQSQNVWNGVQSQVIFREGVKNT